MNTRVQLAMAVAGGVLLALPGLDRTGTNLFFDLSYLTGLLLLVISTTKYGLTTPKTALLLLVVSNVSFWLSYALWSVRSKVVGPPPTVGIDPFAGPVSFWMLLFLAFLIYETAVFVVGLTANRQRSLAAVGLVAVAAQVLVTLRTIYAMIKGV